MKSWTTRVPMDADGQDAKQTEIARSPQVRENVARLSEEAVPIEVRLLTPNGAKTG